MLRSEAAVGGAIRLSTVTVHGPDACPCPFSADTARLAPSEHQRIGESYQLESGEFCAWPKLNTRGYPCTLGVPTASVLQKGYPLAQAHCTAFTSPPVVFMCFAVAPDQTAMAACPAPRRCADCVGNTT